MVDANTKLRPSFFTRFLGGSAAFVCLLLSGMVLDCVTPDGAASPGTALHSRRPMDTDPKTAEAIGREALAKIGYLPLLNLARQAGWVRTKEVRRPLGGDRYLISMNVAQVAGASAFIEVYTEYAVAAGVTSQLDSPFPGPFDVAAVGILVLGLIDVALLKGALLETIHDVLKLPAGTTTSPPPVPEPEKEPEPESDPNPPGPTDRFPPEPRKRPPRCDVEKADYVDCSYRRNASSSRKAALEVAIKNLPRDRQKRPFTTRGTHVSEDIDHNPSEMDHTTYTSADGRTKISIGCYKRCCEDTEAGPLIKEETKCYELNTEDRR